MNDNEREQWVDNDEELYNAQRRSRQPMRTWIRENRAAIDAHIASVMTKKPKQWWEYGS